MEYYCQRQTESPDLFMHPCHSHCPNKYTKSWIQFYLILFGNRKAIFEKGYSMQCKKKCGCLDVLSFEMLKNSFKVKWLTNLLNGQDTIWNAFPKHIFHLIGGTTFLLKCDNKIEKLPIKLSDFHQHGLLAWKLIYKHNFSPTSYDLFNNGNIL